MIKSAAGLPPTKNSKHPHATKETKVGHISKMKDQNGTALYSFGHEVKTFSNVFFLTRKNLYEPNRTRKEMSWTILKKVLKLIFILPFFFSYLKANENGQ